MCVSLSLSYALFGCAVALCHALLGLLQEPTAPLSFCYLYSDCKLVNVIMFTSWWIRVVSNPLPPPSLNCAKLFKKKKKKVLGARDDDTRLANPASGAAAAGRLWLGHDGGVYIINRRRWESQRPVEGVGTPIEWQIGVLMLFELQVSVS